jgi:hypothetical protein
MRPCSRWSLRRAHVARFGLDHPAPNAHRALQGHHVVHGAFQAAATAFAMNILPVIYAGSDGERAAALEKLCRAVVIGAGIGIGIGGLRAVIGKVIESLKPVILDMCKGGKTLQNVGKLVVSLPSPLRDCITRMMKGN